MYFDNFYPGQNGEIVEQLRSNNEPYAYLWGGTGVGKSHLLQAACSEQKLAAYLPLEELSAYRPDILEGLERLELVCIDDIQQIANHTDWEHALCDLYNRLQEAKVPLRVAGNAVPSALGLALADLVSRLAWGPVYHLQMLSDADRALALRQSAFARGLELSDEVVRYLLRHQPRDNVSLFALLNELDYESLVAQRRITIPFIRSLLDERDFI